MSGSTDIHRNRSFPAIVSPCNGSRAYRIPGNQALADHRNTLITGGPGGAGRHIGRRAVPGNGSQADLLGAADLQEDILLSGNQLAHSPDFNLKRSFKRTVGCADCSCSC
ncbi:hypothetical protein D3C81_1521620 [compost metagenome]